MERIRQAYRFLQIKLYGPTPPTTTVIRPFPGPFSTNIPKNTTRKRKRRSSSEEDSELPVVVKRVRPTFCRSTKDYALRLEKLVSALQRLEQAEQTKRTLGELITEHALNEENGIPTDATNLDDLLAQQVALQQTITDEFNGLADHANFLLDSIEDRSRNPLPKPLIAQLKRYDNASYAFKSQRISEANEKDEKDVLKTINGTLFQAENRTSNRGWIPTQSHLRILRARRAGIIKRRRVIEICKQTMTAELRELCETEVPATLESAAFRIWSLRVRELRRRN